MKNLIYHSVIVAIWILLVAGSAVYAQPQYRFQHYSMEDGLASNFTFTIAQDSLGYIWAQYYGGLSRFDGYNFKVYRHDPADSLRSSLDFKLGGLQSDPSGNIWIEEHKSDPESLFTWTKHDRKTDGFITYTMGLKSKGITRKRFEMDGSAIWLGTVNGIYRFDLKTRETKKYRNPHPDSLIAARRNWIRGISVRDTFLLVSTKQGLWILNKRTESFSRPHIDSKDSTHLYHFETGNIIDWPNYDYDDVWFSVNQGFTKINSRYDVIQRFDIAEGHPLRHMNALTRDREGVFWFGTDKGVYRFNPMDSSLLNFRAETGNLHSLMKDQNVDVTHDKDLNIWLTRGALSRMRKPDLPFRNFSFPEGSVGPGMLYRNRDKEYLVLTQFAKRENLSVRQYDIMMAPITPGNIDSLQFQKLPMQIAGAEIEALWQGKKYLWASGYGVGITGFPIDPVTGMPKSSPVKILQNEPGNTNTITTNLTWPVWEASDETVWIGYDGQGISKIDPHVPYGSRKSVTRFPFGKGTNSFLLENEDSFWLINSNGIFLFRHDSLDLVFKTSARVLFKGSDGTLYLGGAGGLYVSEKQSSQYQFNPVPLWSKAEVNAIQEDDFGRLWLCSPPRLVCFHPKEKWAIEFGKNDGIEHANSIQPRSMHKAADGTMFLVDSDGITRFDPSQLQISRVKTFPALTKLLVNNQAPVVASVAMNKDDFQIPRDIGELKELIIDYQHNNFSIEFAAMEIIAPEKNLYRHMLEGYDPDWIETDYKNRTATYTNLSPGDYTFRVRASNHHGIWSDNERTLKVTILPPPWRTAWAYTGYGILFLGALYAARRNIVQRERLKSNLKVAQLEQEREHFELEKAKEVDKVKTSFFTNISHEFRTPLTLIKGPVDTMLERYKDDPEAVQRLKLVQRNSDLLLRLINQLLDLAKLESGTMKVEKSSGDIYGMVKAIANSFTSFASHKQVEVRTDVPEGQQHVMMDKDKIETILINLINNAIKFTPAGGKVTVTAKMQDPGNQVLSGIQNSKFKIQDSKFTTLNSLLLSVSDTGIGIPQDQQQKIFERFHQVSEAHKEVGTGVGLSLVKELVTLMGGTIKVDSEVGKGSEFSVVIPVDLSDAEMVQMEVADQSTGVKTAWSRQTPETLESPRPAQDTLLKERSGYEDDGQVKPHVLVVEDNNDLRDFIIDSLGDEFTFLEADNGKKGLAQATEQIPDLIISDVMMPEMDGMEMAEQIKKDMRTSHIPLIMLTAKSTEASKLEGLEKGADDYLTKPFNRQELLLKVRNGVSRQQKLREKLRAELLSEAPKVEVLSEDEKFLNTVKEKILERLSDEQLSVESLAEDIGLSRVQLYRKVSGLAGIAVNELIRKLRMQRAAQLLAQNWGPVSQVAYEVGFSNLSYFSKVFKEEFGILPSEYETKV